MKNFKIEVQKDQFTNELVNHFIDESSFAIVKRRKEEFVKEKKN